jgi:hypothetical protein
MERINQFPLISAFLLSTVCLTHTGSALAAGYSYYVDYFKVQGSISQRDDFDNGNISPWIVENGTVEESGSHANLKSPGTVSIDGSIVEEDSVMETSPGSPLNISVGSGSATATSRWTTNIHPPSGHAYYMDADFFTVPGGPEPEMDISFSVGIVNANQPIADYLSSILGMPIPTGLFAFFELEQETATGDSQILEFQVAPIVDTSLFDNGSLFLNLHYDDDEITRGVSASIVFGNDEGAQAWEPFSKIAMPAHAGDLVFDNWELGAASIGAVPIPAALPLFSSAMALFGLIGWKRKTQKPLFPL